ncbi:hypothetical protein PO909_032391 [Leuciscus waleckii]
MRFSEQCWLSAPTDRRRVNLPSSSQGEWILKNYAQLWDRFSREEPQSPTVLSPPAKLPVILEGRVLAVVSQGDQAHSTSPEVPATPVGLLGKRGRRTSWESASESSATESALLETDLPKPDTDPAMEKGSLSSFISVHSRARCCKRCSRARCCKRCSRARCCKRCSRARCCKRCSRARYCKRCSRVCSRECCRESSGRFSC